jgi:hypothetical protein
MAGVCDRHIDIWVSITSFRFSWCCIPTIVFREVRIFSYTLVTIFIYMICCHFCFVVLK